MLPAKLDYLFVADFKDGSRYFQNPNDTSRERPLTKSAYHDVLERLEQVLKFTLVDRHHEHEHSVFLDDGHFVTDGTFVANPYGPLRNYRLIYFRRCQLSLEAGGGPSGAPHVTSYWIGWQAQDAQGKHREMKLEIPPLGFGSAKLEQSL